MTKIKNTKKGMAKKTLSMSLVVAMLATSNVPVWAAEFSDGSEATTFTSEAEAPVVDDTTDAIVDNAQDVPAEATISINGAVKGKISASAAKSMTINTNYFVGRKKSAFVNLYAPNNESSGKITTGMTNKAAIDAGYTESYSDAYAEATVLNGKSIGGKGASIDFSNYIGKTVYVTISEIDAGTTVTAEACKIVAVVAVMITPDSAQDYCVNNNVKTEVAWGSKLPTVSTSLKCGATLTKGQWYKNGTQVASDYTTTQDDIGARFEFKGTLNCDDSNLNGQTVTAYTQNIIGKGTSDVVAAVKWNGFSDEITSGGKLTCDYDGNTHQPTIENITTKTGEKISNADLKYTYERTFGVETDDFTSAGTITITAEVVNGGVLAVGSKITATLEIKGVDISKNTAATLTTNPLVYNNKNNGTYLAIPTLTAKNEDEVAEAVKKAGLVVEKDGKTLTYGKDYTINVSVLKNEVGTEKVQVIVTGTGNYAGKIVKKLDITAADISKATVDDISVQNYTGNQIKPAVVVKLDGVTLTYNANDTSKSDYTVEYSNNVNVGKDATVTITGRGNYTGIITKKFEIKSIALSQLKTEILKDNKLTGAGYDYTGKAIDPIKDSYSYNGVEAVWMKGRDFSVTYVPQNTNAGDVKAVITGINNYAGQTEEITFKINPVNISKVKANLSNVTYSPDLNKKTDEIKAGLKVTYNDTELVEKQDFTIDSVSISGKKVALKLTGIKNFTGTATVYADVTAKDINTVTLPKIDAQKYTGYAITASITSGGLKLTSNGTTLVEKLALKDGDTVLTDKDYYIVNIENNTKVGTATINLGGKGNYTGKVSLSFPIVDQELNGTIVDSTNNNSTLLKDVKYSYAAASTIKGITYTGLKVMDEKGQDITNKCNITYSDNKAVGTATITATGKDGFKFNAVNTFRITPAEIPAKLNSEDTLTLTKDTFDYTGEEIKPEYKFTAKDGDYTLVEGTDYKVEYVNNVNAYNKNGVDTTKRPTVKVTGLGNYAAKDANGKDIEVTKNFTISKVTLATTDIVAKDVAYAGGLAVKPEVVIANPKSGKALVEGTDYKVTITKGGTDVGPAEAKIELTETGKQNYVLSDSIATVKFNVTALDLSKATISPIADQAVTGEQIKPTVTVINGSVKLTEGKDYEVSYGANKEIGEGTVTIKALSSNKNYTGSQTVKFNIVKDAPVVGKTMISDVKVVGNKATVILSGEADGASGYDYVISTDKDCTTSKDYDAISKNQVKTSTAFKYVQKGTYYAYCHAWTRDKNGKKVFGDWSEGYEFKVKATTPAAPVITKVKVKGSTITVTYNKVSNVAGYDVVLGTSSKNDNGELRPYRYGDHKILNINKNTVTVQFKNVPKKNWVVGMRSFTKDPDTNKKVFSRWSNLMPAKVK